MSLNHLFKKNKIEIHMIMCSVITQLTTFFHVTLNDASLNQWHLRSSNKIVNNFSN